MEIMELAKELGMKIKQDEKIMRYDAADAAYVSDESLQSLISEYNTQRRAIDEECKKENPDADFTKVIEARIEELYNDITENETFIAYKEAEGEVNELMHMVNAEITFQITGERPCSHDHCDSCSGCN